MPLFVVLKRFEVWLLLAVAAVLIYVALQPADWDDGGEEEEPSPLVETPEPVSPEKSESVAESYSSVALDSVVVEKSEDGSGALVEVTLLARSTTDAEVSDAVITAVTTSGEPVRRFFEPFRESSTMLPDEESLVTTRWWLEKPTDSLWLEVQGQRIEAPLSK